MEKHGFIASAKDIRGTVKHVVGKLVADAEPMSDGKANRMEGKVQTTVGSREEKLEDICARLRNSLPAIEITIGYFLVGRVPVRVEKMREDKNVELQPGSAGS
jgi:uncharacterized protein YjbJ (UPF0337 family)